MIFAFLAAMSATAWAGFADWLCSGLICLLRRERSMHIRIFSVPFLG